MTMWRPTGRKSGDTATNAMGGPGVIGTSSVVSELATNYALRARNASHRTKARGAAIRGKVAPRRGEPHHLLPAPTDLDARFCAVLRGFQQRSGLVAVDGQTATCDDRVRPD